MLWVVPHALGKVLSRYYPLLLRPLPLKLPDFEIGMYWHDRFHRDPQNKWFREIVGSALRESVAA
ncbi:HTH-type transcriptional regulator SyrM 1 [compost metagenome]